MRAEKHVNSVDLQSVEGRKQLGKLTMRLFDHWALDTVSQLNLLGLSASSRALLSKYRQGDSPISATRDVLDRIGWLLSIHKALRLLYPKNPTLRYTWINRRNAAFNNITPLDVMKEEGVIGLAKVARYLDYVRGI